MRLSQQFDLISVSGPISLSFKTWYDLEEDYDYVFLSATTDQQKWDILQTPSCTSDNPSGNSYGCGYNGTSLGWITEVVDLSAYAGKVVTLQFDYVTDAAVNGTGFFIDDFRIDTIGYVSDLEQDEGGWNAEGFVRIQNVLPQSFDLAIITYGDEVSIQHMTVDENNGLSAQITIDRSVDSVVIVVSGTTPYTRLKAAYQLELK
jgi:bacillopeptidase F (M6 metalloprotease family)